MNNFHLKIIKGNILLSGLYVILLTSLSLCLLVSLSFKSFLINYYENIQSSLYSDYDVLMSLNTDNDTSLANVTYLNDLSEFYTDYVTTFVCNSDTQISDDTVNLNYMAIDYVDLMRLYSYDIDSLNYKEVIISESLASQYDLSLDSTITIGDIKLKVISIEANKGYFNSSGFQNNVIVSKETMSEIMVLYNKYIFNMALFTTDNSAELISKLADVYGDFSFKDLANTFVSEDKINYINSLVILFSCFSVLGVVLLINYILTILNKNKQKALDCLRLLGADKKTIQKVNILHLLTLSLVVFVLFSLSIAFYFHLVNSFLDINNQINFWWFCLVGLVIFLLPIFYSFDMTKKLFFIITIVILIIFKQFVIISLVGLFFIVCYVFKVIITRFKLHFILYKIIKHNYFILITTCLMLVVMVFSIFDTYNSQLYNQQYNDYYLINTQDEISDEYNCVNLIEYNDVVCDFFNIGTLVGVSSENSEFYGFDELTVENNEIIVNKYYEYCYDLEVGDELSLTINNVNNVFIIKEFIDIEYEFGFYVFVNYDYLVDNFNVSNHNKVLIDKSTDVDELANSYILIDYYNDFNANNSYVLEIKMIIFIYLFVVVSLFIAVYIIKIVYDFASVKSIFHSLKNIGMNNSLFTKINVDILLLQLMFSSIFTIVFSCIINLFLNDIMIGFNSYINAFNLNFANIYVFITLVILVVLFIFVCSYFSRTNSRRQFVD